MIIMSLLYMTNSSTQPPVFSIKVSETNNTELPEQTITNPWVSVNPGHGGRLQGLTVDPNTSGRMFAASDMEGYYESTDYGEHWHYRGKNVPASNTLIVQVAKNTEVNKRRVFVGTMQGMARSDDGGQTYTKIVEAGDDEIGIITIDKNNSNNVYAGRQWLVNGLNPNNTVTVTASIGPRIIYVSKDAGNTWQIKTYATGDNHNRVFSINVNPINSNEVIISTATGNYSSIDGGDNWTLITPPVNTNGESMGCDFTTDGNYLYSIYNKSGNSWETDPNTPSPVKSSALYVKSYPNGSWQELGVYPVDSRITGGIHYWQPKVWQKVEGNNHYVLAGQFTQGGNEALYEGRFVVNDGQISGSIVKIFGYLIRRDVNYDIGWNVFNSQSRNNTYFPSEWNTNWVDSRTGQTYTYTRGVFTMSQQSFFVGDASKGNVDWNIQSTHKVGSPINNVQMYRTNGTQSTFNYDSAAYGTYMIQGQADNLIVESYDGGHSWEQENNPSAVMDGHAVEVIPLEPPLVLGSFAWGYGGGVNTGAANIFYKRLTRTDGPFDQWVRLTNGVLGEPGRFGLPNRRTWSIEYDKSNPDRVYMGTDVGLYITDSISSLIDDDTNNNQNFRFIGGSNTSEPGSASVRRVMPDPINSNRVYLFGGTGLYIGTRNGTDYTWVRVNAGGTTTGTTSTGPARGDMTAWSNGTKTYMSFTRSFMANGLINDELYLSVDGSPNGVRILTPNQAIGILGVRNPWYNPTIHDVSMSGMVGYGNKLYVFISTGGAYRKGFGVLKGTIDINGVLSWEDWTGNGTGQPEFKEGEMEYSRAKRSKIYMDNQNQPYILTSTTGAGSWKRMLLE